MNSDNFDNYPVVKLFHEDGRFYKNVRVAHFTAPWPVIIDARDGRSHNVIYVHQGNLEYRRVYAAKAMNYTPFDDDREVF